MNIKQAHAKIAKLLGKRAAIQDHKRPSSDEQRAAAHAAMRAARERRKVAESAMNARRDALLSADPEWQRHAAEYRAAGVALEAAGDWHYFRYSAGVVGSMFFSVTAEADNLDELVAKVCEAKK